MRPERRRRLKAPLEGVFTPVVRARPNPEFCMGRVRVLRCDRANFSQEVEASRDQPPQS